MGSFKERSDEDIVDLVKEGNESAFKYIVEKHSGIFLSTIMKMLSRSMPNHIVQDFLQEKEMFMWQACRTYNRDSNSKYSTWLYNQTKWECLKKIKKQTRHSSIIIKINDFSLDKDKNKSTIETLPDKGSDSNYGSKLDSYETLANKDDLNLIFKILDGLEGTKIPSKVRAVRIFKMRVLEKMTWDEISKRVNRCKQQSINIFEKQLKEIQKEYNNYGK